MNVDSIEIKMGDEDKSMNLIDEGSIEIPFHLFEFLSTPHSNTQSVCRICFSTDNKIMFPLYSSKESGMFATMFTALTAIEIYPGDDLPANVCKSCQTQIVSCYKFKVQCEKATSILKSVLKCLRKVKPVDNNISPEDVPEWHNTEIKKECDILNSEGIQNRHDVIPNTNNDVCMLTKTEKNSSALVTEINNPKAIEIKKEFNNLKLEDAEYLDDVICNKNYTLCTDIKKQKRKKVTTSVTDSNTLLNGIVSKKNSSKKNRRKCYSCKYCNKKFNKIKLLRAHLNNNHPKTQKIDLEYSCSHCNDSFSSEHDLNLHLMLHTKGPKWRCNQCEKIFQSKSLLRRHIYRHMESKRYSCDTCGKLFTELYALRRHARVHTGEIVEKKHECHLCDKKYSESGLLAAHIARHEGFRPYVCSDCGKAFPSTRLLSSHALTHSDNKPYACTYCDKRFRHESTRNTHHRTHTGEKPYVCSTCGKTFIQNSNLKLHMRTHTGEKPYSCSICNRKFSSGSSVKTHERTHTGERPYKCEICGKRFARVNMRAHMLLHTGERPYACSMCPKKFVNATRLRDHSRVHTGEKPFECENCSQKFQTKSHLLRHIKTHDKGKKSSKLKAYSSELTLPNIHSKSSDNIDNDLRIIKDQQERDTNMEEECRTIVFNIEEVPLEVNGELVLQGESKVKTEMLVIDGSHDYQTENILNTNGVIVSDINYANNLVPVNEIDGTVTTSETVLEGATVKLYQLDQSLLQIHSAGGQLTISKITSKMTANF